jgi:hypothetical protein
VALPTFLIAGVPKAGTSALAAYLSEHPDVFMSAEKELHFFDRRDRDEKWYRSNFDGAGGAAAIGEATPTYILSRPALERMRALLPDARLVVLMRNPVDRAYSHFWWNRALTERRDFASAVRSEMAGGPSDRPLPPNARPGYWSYTGGGRYAELLQRACEYYPRDRVLALVSEELRSTPDAVYGEVCRFVGVSDAHAPGNLGTVVNPAYRLRSPKLRELMMRYRAWKRLPKGWAKAIDALNRAPLTYPPMDPGVRAQLVEWFQPANEALSSWLGRDLTVWSR